MELFEVDYADRPQGENSEWMRLIHAAGKVAAGWKVKPLFTDVKIELGRYDDGWFEERYPEVTVRIPERVHFTSGDKAIFIAHTERAVAILTCALMRVRE